MHHLTLKLVKTWNIWHGGDIQRAPSRNNKVGNVIQRLARLGLGDGDFPTSWLVKFDDRMLGYAVPFLRLLIPHALINSMLRPDKSHCTEPRGHIFKVLLDLAARRIQGRPFWIWCKRVLVRMRWSVPLGCRPPIMNACTPRPLTRNITCHAW